jgi:hypothetical protein
VSPFGPGWLRFGAISFFAHFAPASKSMTRSWPEGFALAL